MEQISLEDKVSNTLKWLANQIACIQVYKKWFNIIAEEADVLTAGNVSHKKAMIKGMAARSAEFVERHSVGITDCASDLK